MMEYRIIETTDGKFIPQVKKPNSSGWDGIFCTIWGVILATSNLEQNNNCKKGTFDEAIQMIEAHKNRELGLIIQVKRIHDIK